MALNGVNPVGYRGRRVVVFGASGFIGRRVVRMLSGVGADVRAVIRSDAAALTVEREFTVMFADLSVPGAAAQVISSVCPSVTFNLTGYGIDPAERDVALSTRINSDVAHELAIGACGQHADADWPGQHLVHAGSALEYGTAAGDLREDIAPDPTTMYGRTKLAGTRSISTAVDAGQVRGVTARLFTVYGPGERSGRLLPSLLDAARTQSAHWR